MSWQAMEAVRDHSESRGATRTIAFVLASYADKYGNDVFISLDRLMAEAKVNRKSAVNGRRWLVDNGEAELVDRPDGQPKMRGRVRVMSMRPLMERARRLEEAAAEEADEGSVSELQDRGSETEPHPKSGSPSEPTGVRSGAGGVRSVPSSSSASAPDTERTRTDTETESPDARAGTRAIIPPYEPPRNETQRRAEQEEIDAEIAALEGQLATSRDPQRTQAAINTLQAELEQLRSAGAVAA